MIKTGPGAAIRQLVAVALGASLYCSQALYAESDSHDGHETSAAAEEHHSAEVHEEHEEHHAEKNAWGVFLGFTHAGRRENDPAVGFEYVRSISDNFAIGGTLEYTFGDSDFLVAVVPFQWYVNDWYFKVAPGIEDSSHGTEGLLRLGVGYLFELSEGWEISPQINLDLVDSEEVWVFGFAFGRRF